MVRSTALLAAVAALALDASAQSMYTKKSPVLQVDISNYDRLIAKSNYTSIVEFYAPWCGHCKNLKPAWETAAKSLAGIAKVAAINCDDEKNKPLCGQMGVQGFPTLKIVKPGRKPGKPVVEDYQGPRQAKAIVDIVKSKIPNNVKKLTDAKLDEWLAENKDSAKAILFSDKGPVSATLRTTAIDFAGIISIAQVKKDQEATVAKYGVEKYPTVVLLHSGSDDPVKYDGEMNKEAIVKFLSQVAPPNPDCPDAKAKKSKSKKDEKKESKSSSKFSKASASHKSSEAASAATSAADESIEEANKPTESPDPNTKTEDTPEPIVIPEEEVKATIKSLAEAAELQELCLNEKKLTCILAILPKGESSEAATSVVTSLASIHKKYDAQKTRLFPFVAVPASNPLASSLIKELSLGSEDQVHLIATHGKKAWYKKYSGETFGSTEVEQWVDALRMGEGKREKLPESLIATAPKEEIKAEKVAEQEPIKIEVEEIVEEVPSEAPSADSAPEHSEL
ncbi:protein disulfide-isomerase MPD1 precursor [Lentithecium fluviatile CBS 122367]|uniref:protein disulfide-isomerase n=1 Tax=Lentithecium fluviatile CBS 122367 TaxID=1168545 RepID=A0A6G1IXA7_9PLEO|nr:protein disulfide-isomerase MPD1 precursor [Lentithecium fluviatile CBS 122367]